MHAKDDVKRHRVKTAIDKPRTCPSLLVLRKKPSCQTLILDFWEVIKFLWFQPPKLWRFVVAALVNKYIPHTKKDVLKVGLLKKEKK